MLVGGKSARTGDQRAIRPHHDRVQQADLLDVACKRSNIAEVAPVADTDLDVGDPHRGPSDCRDIPTLTIASARTTTRHKSPHARGSGPARFLDLARRYVVCGCLGCGAGPRSGYREG